MKTAKEFIKNINNVEFDGQWSVGLSGPFGLVQPCFVQSLHQLQNLYFALTGEELDYINA